LSRGYFESINCRREIVCTFDGNKKPLAIVHEPDAAHGGAPIDALQLEFNAQPWSSAAAASHMATHIFEPSQIIEWLRIKVFQTVSVRLISEQLVRASPKYVRMEKCASEAHTGPGSLPQWQPCLLSGSTLLCAFALRTRQGPAVSPGTGRSKARAAF
jgi:hypothetical protein